MSVHSSFSEQGYLKEFREELNRIKSPFLQKIKASAQTFQTKMKDFQQKLNHTQGEENQQTQQAKTLKSIYRHKQMDSEENMFDKENQEVISTMQQIEIQKMHLKNKKTELPLHLMKEWTGNNQFSFNTMEQVKENFINVFNKKLGVSKKKKQEKCYDFKDDEKHMIFNIFHELENQYGPDKGFVNIDRIIEFFQQNQLFYLFYNIHPNQLKYVLKQSARTKPNCLTKKEFLYVFIMDRPLLKDLSNPFQKIVHRKCILDTEGWQELKTIFNTLDTFGNQTIHIKSFIQKLKNCHSNPNLIYTPVIQFPEIQRVYTLKKVVFDLEHKFQFQDKITWKDIEQLIFNFNHKEEPTLDIIFERHLEQATILLDSNYFLIEKRIIVILKHIFEKCPKFSDFFVNTKFLCTQLLQSHDLKMFYRSPVRQKIQIYGGYYNLEETIRSMNIKAPQYIDLDEFLEFFSIKGSVTNVLQEIHDSNETSQAEQQAHDQRTKMLRKIRSLEKLEISRKNKKPKRPVRQLTDFQEFNLTKKQKQTIRQKKVREMIKQKQQIQEKELTKQFKANPIPADLNPQRIKQQQKRMEMKRKKKLQQVAKRRQQDKELMSYLRANTRLFDPLNKQTDEDKLEKTTIMNKLPVQFTHKPVPWFVQENMLSKIEREKSERKQKLYEDAKIKYVRSWNKLPDFFFKNGERDNSMSNSLIDELQKINSQRHNIKIKASPVPDFKSLHKEFEEQLQKKKQSFEPTKIQEFRLTSPKPDKRQIHSQYVSPQGKTLNNSRWRQTLHSPPANKISTTKKTQEWMQHNKKVQELRRMAKQEERQKEKQRVSKQKNFAKFMSKKLREQDKQMPNLEAQTAKKLNKHKQNVQYLEKMTQRQLSEMYARVLQRPFLFQTATGQKQNKKPTKKGENKKKLTKKAVIKHIEPIDMSEQTTNKYRDSHGDQDGNNYGMSNHYEQKSYNHSGHDGLNQSF